MCASVVVVVGLLAGCATPPAPDPTAEVPYCHKTNKGRVIACTAAPSNEVGRFLPTAPVIALPRTGR
jgi:hypothetical protein